MENNESNEIKEEAKRLIEKTKQMMEHLTIEQPSLSISNNKKTNNFSSNYVDKISLTNPSLDSLIKLPPSRQSNTVTLDKNLINVALLDSRSDLKLTIKNLTAKMAEMSVYIKQLEKENKNKDDIISSLRKKLINNSDHIDSLNKTIIKDRADNILVENSKLNRRVTQLEKTLNENTFMYEQIIKEYKQKLSKLNNEQKDSSMKLENVFSNNQKLDESNKKMINEIEEQKELINVYEHKVKENENKEKIYIKRIELLENNIKVMLSLIEKLYHSEQVDFSKRTNLYLKIKSLISN